MEQPTVDASGAVLSANSKDFENEIAGFKAAWQRDERPTIESYLPIEPQRRQQLLIELVLVELELRIKVGETARVEEYLARFRELSEASDFAVKLATREFFLRRPTEPDLSPVDYGRRFPHLSEPIMRAIKQIAAEETRTGIDTRIGTQLRDYRLLAKLGEGGMGTVYKALHTHLDKLVAIKVLPESRTRDEQSVARFKREMKAVGKLHNPHIVTAFDAGEFDGRHFLAMEYVEGLDLAELVRQQGPLPVADACELVRQAADGLEDVHRHAMVHRDIKPSNLMLTSEGLVKILDLGLALLHGDAPGAGELTGTSQTMGTIDYMAPEQAGDSHTVDGRADIYSLGCTLFKLLAGEAPFTGPRYSTPIQKMMAHTQAPVPPITHRRPDVPKELAAVVERTLAKSPDARYATAGELAAVLAQFVAGSDLRRLWSQSSSVSFNACSATLSHTPRLTSAAVTDTSGDLAPPVVPRPEASSVHVGLLAGIFGPLLKLVRTRIRINIKIKVVVVSAAMLLMASVAYWGVSRRVGQVAMHFDRPSVASSKPRSKSDLPTKNTKEAAAQTQIPLSAHQDDLPKEDDPPATPDAVELPPEMIEPQPPAPMPEPDIHAPPPAATPKQVAALRRALATVLASLGDRDLESAQEQLDLAKLDAVTPDLEAEVERLQLLTRYVEHFWKAVSKTLPNLEVGEEFTVNGVIGAVVEARADMLVIRVQGRNREYPLREIPTKLAVLLADRSLDKADNETPVVIAAFLLADPKGDDQEARKLFQQAATQGVDVAPLLQELESRQP